MKTNTHHTNTTAFEFVVNKKQVTKKKILKTSILYDKVELSANQSVDPYKNILISNPKTFELNFMKNAFLNDELIIKNNIKKLNSTELELSVVVMKKSKNYNDIICKAVFGYHFKKAS